MTENEVYRIVEPFLHRMSRQDAYDAFLELVSLGRMTHGQLTRIVAFWAQDETRRETTKE